MRLKDCIEKLLERGLDFDVNEQFTAAFACYKDALCILGEDINDNQFDELTMSDMKAIYDHYANRIDQLQAQILDKKLKGLLCEQYHIENNSTGNSYNSLFGRFLDDEVENVIIQDSYIETTNQCQNFLRLCELLLKKCVNLKSIEVITSKHSSSRRIQKECFKYLTTELLKHNVNLTVKHSETIRDMKITLSSGWIIKLSRGLNIYKQFQNTFSFGVHDLDLRPCYKTVMLVNYSNAVNPTYTYVP